MKVIPLIVLLLAAQPVGAQVGWRDEQLRVTPNTDARKSVKNFGGWLLITSDADWEAKWATPSDTVPHFAEAKSVSRGDRIFILTFFANPKLDISGKANVTCDIDVTRPDGTVSTHQPNAVCFKGVIENDPHNMYLSNRVVGFVGDPGDPAGEWVVRVTLKDNVRHVSLSLRASYVLN